MTKDSVHIAVDALGGDFGPATAVTGALLAVARHGVRITLIGQSDRIRPYLASFAGPNSSVEVVEPEGAVAAGRKVSQKEGAWNKHILAHGHRLLKKGEADAFVSAGDTGEVFLSAVRFAGRTPGIQRPCIAVPLPTTNRYVLLLDAGANPECHPEFLVDFALMGAQYTEIRLGRPSPSVYLLSNGTESEKGTALTRAAHVLLNSLEHINYKGYAEPYQLSERDDIDVLVTDGFSGNVLVKGMETASRMYSDALRKAFNSSWRSKLGYGLAKSALQDVRAKADPRRYGGAILLGVNGIVIVAHGSDDAEAFCSAVRQAQYAVEHDVLNQVARALDPGN